MALTCASAFTTKTPCFLQPRARTAGRVALPVSPVCSSKRAEQNSTSEVRLTKLAGVSTAVATLLAAGNAQAAQEIADLAAKDNRAGLLALLLTPALGWVAFNILPPALNQLKGMQNASAKRSTAIGLGLGAALLCSQSADAAEEVAQLAAGRDNRVFIIATLFVPVVGWVGFNILGPALNQLQAQVQKNTDSTARQGKSKGKGRR